MVDFSAKEREPQKVLAILSGFVFSCTKWTLSSYSYWYDSIADLVYKMLTGNLLYCLLNDPACAGMLFIIVSLISHGSYTVFSWFLCQ